MQVTSSAAGPVEISHAERRVFEVLAENVRAAREHLERTGVPLMQSAGPGTADIWDTLLSGMARGIAQLWREGTFVGISLEDQIRRQAEPQT